MLFKRQWLSYRAVDRTTSRLLNALSSYLNDDPEYEEDVFIVRSRVEISDAISRRSR